MGELYTLNKLLSALQTRLSTFSMSSVRSKSSFWPCTWTYRCHYARTTAFADKLVASSERILSYVKEPASMTQHTADRHQSLDILKLQGLPDHFHQQRLRKRHS